mmetsp:Transcript_28500/g.48484  ORF Transcript_28500/g.48484 Transcript_28500/m.48484 type:complete len:88 (+) Transcript_28500:1199-1462(+)
MAVVMIAIIRWNGRICDKRGARHRFASNNASMRNERFMKGLNSPLIASFIRDAKESDAVTEVLMVVFSGGMFTLVVDLLVSEEVVGE